MSKLFFQNYHYDMVKCRPNVNFKEMNTECSKGKNNGFCLLRGICQGVYQTKYYYGSVKKSKFSFSCHLQIDKENQ